MKKQNNNYVLTIFIVALIILIITLSTQARKGAINGIGLCENVIVPALLPILILINIIVKTNCSNVINNIFAPIICTIFRLPKCCASAIILGLIGGFPSGAVLTQQLYNNNEINQNQAQRIMAFNFSGGLAFIITAVGAICYKSTKIGLVLYLANLLSSFIIGIVLGAFAKDDKCNKYCCCKKLNFTDAMVESVNETVKNIMIMCAYIIVFSAFEQVLSIPNYITPFIEITNGICGRSAVMSLPFCALFLSFGGFCIHFQLIGILKQMDIKYFNFFVFRVVGALLSFVITKIYVSIFPQIITVFSNAATISPKLTQANIWLSIVMIIGCVVVVFDIDNKKITT